MIKKIVSSVFLLSSVFALQTTSLNLATHSQVDNLPLLYLSKNRIPQDFTSNFLSNIRYTNSNENLLFVSNIFFNDQQIKLFEFGLKYNFKSTEFIFGMIDDKDYDSLSVNEHIVFGNNHEPIKRITIKSKGYLPLPWGKDNSLWKRILFSYDFTNGVLDKDYKYLWDDYYWQEAKEVYYSKEPRLHSKSLQFKIKLAESIDFELGLNHAAIWGGTVVNVTNDTTKIFPNDLKSLHKVIFWQTGTKEYDRNDVTGGVIGNHLGSIDFAIINKSQSLDIKYYYQHIFEDGGSFWFDNKFDGLWGINIKNKNNNGQMKEVAIEFLNTKFQSGSIHPDGVDSYFWHDQYPAGWQYKGVSMGSLFVTPNQNRSKILFLSSLIKIKQNINLTTHFGYGNIYHYYGYKGWNVVVENLFTQKYTGKYKSIYLSLSTQLKNGIQLEYDVAFEEKLDIEYDQFLVKNISSNQNKFINIKLSKDFLLK